MKPRMMLLLWTALACCSLNSAFADELEGYIRVGGRIKAKIFLISESKAATLCDGAYVDAMTKISGMSIRAQGEWQKKNAKGRDLEEPCFAVNDYLITKTRTGEPTVVGLLKKNQQGYFIDAGTDRIFFDEKLPVSFSKLEGQRVIVALSRKQNLELSETPTTVLWVSPVPLDGLDQ